MKLNGLPFRMDSSGQQRGYNQNPTVYRNEMGQGMAPTQILVAVAITPSESGLPMAKQGTAAVATTHTQGVPKHRLSDLLLDPNNARFGSMVGQLKEQADILDHIVETFGVEDVLSSLAVNGYFDAEPLVCRLDAKTGKPTVVEGNRRLAACLILAGDPRAQRQAGKTANALKLWEKNGRPSIDPVPTIIYGPKEDRAALLSYLGVRHIAASQPWDSYAKAAWVAQVVEKSSLSLRAIAEMIGDQHRTIHRMLQGYYFAQQLIKAGVFRPEDSLRRGRGSVTDYPFSWLYTILGYTAAREFVGIKDDNQDPAPDPVPKAKLKAAGVVVRAMFGDRSKGRNAAIADSRDLGELASALADPVKLGYLEQGKSVQEITKLTQPLDTRLSAGLTEVRDILRDLSSSLSERDVSRSVAESMAPIAEGNRRLIGDIIDKLKKVTGD